MATEAFVSEEIKNSTSLTGVPETVNRVLVNAANFTYNFNLDTIKNIYGSDVKKADLLFFSSSYDNHGGAAYVLENGTYVAYYQSRGSWNDSIHGQLFTVYPGKSYTAYSRLVRGYYTQIVVRHVYR